MSKFKVEGGHSAQYGKDWIVNGTPPKSGVYAVLYSRAKSKEVKHGTARYSVRGSDRYPKGWDAPVNQRGVSLVTSYDDDYDGFPFRARKPQILAWSHG